MSYKREINSLLDYSSDEIVFDQKDEDNKDNKENRHNSEHRDNRNNHNDRNHEHGKKNKNSDNKEFSNPVIKMIKSSDYYDKDDMYKALVKQDGLYKMLRDLNNWVKNPKSKKPTYINFCLKDIVVAAALPDAIDDVLKDKKYDLSKKDFEAFMGELLMVIKSSKNDTSLQNKYSEESIENIREGYTSILYRLNKKKGKKLKELDLEENVVKKLIVLTAGNPNISIYPLLKYLYKNASNLSMSEKMLLKIFKICYGKENMPEVMKCIMNEKMNPLQNNPFGDIKGSREESEMWVLIDKTMRDYLEGLGKKDLKKIILAYIKERKISKKQGDTSRRRFGDRRSIHPEDYPNLTKVMEDLERNDFSIIEFLR